MNFHNCHHLVNNLPNGILVARSISVISTILFNSSLEIVVKGSFVNVSKTLKLSEATSSWDETDINSGSSFYLSDKNTSCTVQTMTLLQKKGCSLDLVTTICTILPFSVLLLAILPVICLRGNYDFYDIVDPSSSTNLVNYTDSVIYFRLN